MKNVRELNELGLSDGVTTNPSLVLKSARNISEMTREICNVVEGTVPAEVTAAEYAEMTKEAAVLSKIA